MVILHPLDRKRALQQSENRKWKRCSALSCGAVTSMSHQKQVNGKQMPTTLFLISQILGNSGSSAGRSSETGTEHLQMLNYSHQITKI